MKKDNITKYTAFCGDKKGVCAACLKIFSNCIWYLLTKYMKCLGGVGGIGTPILYIRGLLEKYPTFGREKETGLLGALDT